MNWRWLICDYVPPELQFSRARKREVRRAAMRLPGAHATLFFVGLLAILLVGAPVIVLFFAIRPFIGGSTMTIVAVRAVLLALAFYTLAGSLTFLVQGLMGLWLWRPYVHRALNGLGYSVCPNCTYLLTGLPDEADRCPECGHLIKPPKCPGCQFETGPLPGRIVSCPRCGSALTGRRTSYLSKLNPRVAMPPVDVDEKVIAEAKKTIWGPLRIRRWTLIVGGVILIVGVPITAYVIHVKYDRFAVLLTLATIMIIWLAAIPAYRWLYILPMRRALRILGYDLCIDCGRRFREDETHNRCPECGWNREAQE